MPGALPVVWIRKSYTRINGSKGNDKKKPAEYGPTQLLDTMGSMGSLHVPPAAQVHNSEQWVRTGRAMYLRVSCGDGRAVEGVGGEGWGVGGRTNADNS